jgi:hypothetical protein
LVNKAALLTVVQVLDCQLVAVGSLHAEREGLERRREELTDEKIGEDQPFLSDGTFMGMGTCKVLTRRLATRQLGSGIH